MKGRYSGFSKSPGAVISVILNLDFNHDFYFDENYAHRQDGGEYICTASNRVGPEAEAKLLLVISCKISQ